MNTKCTPEQLCMDLLSRSVCAVQVAAVAYDDHGIFGWGWNSMGSSGLGEHAEAACIRRSNRDRLVGANMCVVSRRRKSGRLINSMPCDRCQRGIVWAEIVNVWYCVGGGIWKLL